MSGEGSLQLENQDDERLKGGICERILQTFGFNGHVNYAFIYGTWEIIRARKVGTTHTKVDYVVYRVFYPVILIGVSLFGVIAVNSLGRYFCLLEVWNMVLHIAYAFIFLQNVLTNNLHRDPVKGRQKIPEKLNVTDEIEKGGHKFYICKRYSILPNDTLYHTERLIWLMFNIIASMNISMWLVYSLQQAEQDTEHSENYEKLRISVPALFALLDVFLTPIPMRLAHVIYPLFYSLLYSLFLYVIFKMRGYIIYKQLDWEKRPKRAVNAVIYGVVVVVLIHFIVVGLSTLRDYIVSILDDSKSPKQLQNLRSQKRLARRKLMNFVEGPDGRVVEIILEKHTQVPASDIFIQKAKEHLETSESGSSEDEEEEDNIKKSTEIITPAEQSEDDFVPISVPIKPPPRPRYTTPVKANLVFSSSSSSKEEDDLEDIKDFALPQPPTTGTKTHHRRASKIPIPLHTKLALHRKPRDSKEAIQHKFSIDRDRSPGDSPPTPPLIRLVQTMIKQKDEIKEILSNTKLPEISGEPQSKDVASIKTVGAKGDSKVKLESLNTSLTGYPSEDENEPGSDSDVPVSKANKPIAAKVINTPAHVKEWKEKNKDIFQDFRSELIQKLQREQNMRLDGVGDAPASVGIQRNKSKELGGLAHPKKVKKKGNKKGILKPSEGERHEHHDKKRLAKLIKRRSERMFQVRQGHPVYQPLETPNIKQSTTFHYLGTKLKGEKAGKTVLNPQELQVYREHPGIAPTDDLQVSGSKSIVSFHPVVRYFELNEAKATDKKNKFKK